MKKVIIADTIAKYDSENGHPFGHYMNFSKQYYRALSPNYEVLIACAKMVKHHLPGDIETIELKFAVKYKAKNGRMAKLVNIIKQQLNLMSVLLKEADLIIIQSPDSLLQLFPLAVYFGRKKILCVAYRDLLQKDNRLWRRAKRLLFAMYRRKISGIITGIEEVGRKYGLEYLVIPDYINLEDSPEKPNADFTYDLAILGINSRSKNLEDVVRSFRNTKYRVLIAGRFVDKTQLSEIKSISSSNVIIKDEYIDDKTYKDIMQKARFIALPYNPTTYKLQSSGVFYEALYSGTPVICSNTSFLKIVRERRLGYVYENSISESICILDNIEIYEAYRKNVISFVDEVQKESISKINYFIESRLK